MQRAASVLARAAPRRVHATTQDSRQGTSTAAHGAVRLPHGTAAARLASAYRHSAYRILGRRLEGDRPRLAAALLQAGLKASPGMFLSLAFTTALLAGAATAVVAGLVVVAPAPTPLAVAMAVATAALAAALTPAAFLLSLRSRVQNRRMAVERELPFTLSELSVLASIGLAPIALMRRMAARGHDPALSAEFRKVVARVDTEGCDLVTALAQTARESPSDVLRSILWDLANLVHQGGDLEAFLRQQTDTVLDAVRNGQKSFTERLGTFADMYITIVLLGVMFLAVGAFLIDAFRTTAGGLSANGLLVALKFGLIPAVTVSLALLLASVHGKGSS